MTDNLPEKIDRELEFIRNLSEFPTVREAGRAAGYSENYCNTNLYNKLKSDKFLGRIREYYKSEKHIQLPVINKIEQKALAAYLDSPELAIKNPGLLKDLKTAAGIKQEEEQETQYINIKQAQIFMDSIINPKPKEIEGEVIDT